MDPSPTRRQPPQELHADLQAGQDRSAQSLPQGLWDDAGMELLGLGEGAENLGRGVNIQHFV